jgi:hypothetical protein
VGPPTGEQSPSESASPSPIAESDTDKPDDTSGQLRTLALLMGSLVVVLGVGGSVGLYLTREPKGVA